MLKVLKTHKVRAWEFCNTVINFDLNFLAHMYGPKTIVRTDRAPNFFLHLLISNPNKDIKHPSKTKQQQQNYSES